MKYTLSIVFKSNERPYSTIYDPSPYVPADSDEDAIGWATRFGKEMGNAYAITLLKDGEPLKVIG